MTAPPGIDRFLAELEAVQGGALPTDAGVTAAVRAYLAEARAHLEKLHRAGANGQTVNEANSDLTDRLLRRLFRLAEAEYYAGGAEFGQRLSVVAVGGYARRELSIHSDIDLLFLYPRRLNPYVEKVTGKLQMWLWDGGLTVGCATRTIAETLDLGSGDATVRTAILDARFLIGDTELFHEFTDSLREETFSDKDNFLSERVVALRERHKKYGESLYLLQPNVKEGAGGLRDYHNAYWATRAAHPNTRGLDDLLHFGLLTENEMEQYRAAIVFLWRLRNELHLISKRKNDQMSFEHQEQVAAAWGYGEGASLGDELPVERFMRDYYRHARVVQSLSELVIEQCCARAGKQAPRTPAHEVADGFRVADQHLEIPHASNLRERPARLLTAYAVAQDERVQLSRTARRLVRENLDLVDDRLRRDPEASAAFLRILDGPHRVMRTLTEMNEDGLLSAFLPEWEHIFCRWQHVIYHIYTVDVHTLFLIEELRRLERGDYSDALPELTTLMQEVTDVPVLFLGCLLHDIGKGFGGDHSNRGAERALACLERLGLSPERVERVVFLVRHHLLMSHIAQRRDLSDARLIVEFARTCGDRENLRNLYLLTFADIRASSPAGWTEWKSQLLRELFTRTSEFLETGSDDPLVALEQIEARVERRQDAARAELRGLGVGEARISGFFSIMPRRYFVSHSPRQIARHALVVLAYAPEKVISHSVRELSGGISEFLICTADVHGLYATVSGVLTAKGINILGSHVYTARSGLALEVYRVATPAGGPDEQRDTWKAVASMVQGALSGLLDLEALIQRRRRPFLRAAEMPPSPRPAEVIISNAESDFYTIVDVSANDRLGLLYDLTRTIAQHGLEIYISKAATVMDQVADTFYLKDAEGKKILEPERMERLREDLLRAAEGPARGA
jgi:[protein-PII] uridylyltransferase